MNRAALIQALPPAARAMCRSKYIDPADAFIAHTLGKTPEQARSKARNARRSFGQSWPDHLPAHALLDPAELLEIQHSCGLHALAPDEILEAVEAATAAIGGDDAARLLAQADLREVDTKALAAVSRVTQRRAQQIKREKVDLAERQMPLWDDGEDVE